MTPDESVARALELLRTGQMLEAIRLLQSALVQTPNHPAAAISLQWLQNERQGQILEGLLGNINTAVGQLTFALGRQAVATILADPRYADPLRLERFGAKVYSQNDEDGMIREIFRRIGTANRRFLEFGVEDGRQCNSHLLLHEGWSGAWLEADAGKAASIRERFAPAIQDGRLTIENVFVDRETINDTIVRLGLPTDLDLLAIDIDGNDYYVFEAITAIKPRVVVIEYNATFPPPIRAVIPYDRGWVWQGGDYFGASLSSLTALADRLGYRLVGCNIAGANAFFVREDLIGDKFQAPFTAENFYHPPRQYLTVVGFGGGHEARFGRYLPL
jgi:hypothetical protein